MKPGPKLESGTGMVRLSHCGPWVGADVKDTLAAWKGIYGVPVGRSITAAVRFASTHPDFELPLDKVIANFKLEQSSGNNETHTHNETALQTG